MSWDITVNFSLITLKLGLSSGSVAQHILITWRLDYKNDVKENTIEAYIVWSLALKMFINLSSMRQDEGSGLFFATVLYCTDGFTSSYTELGQLLGCWSIWPRCTRSTTSGFLARPYGISPHVNTSQHNTPYAHTSLLLENRVKFRTWRQWSWKLVANSWFILPLEDSTW